MQALARWVDSGRIAAGSALAGFALLGLVLFPALWLSQAVLAFMLLRYGWRASATPILGALAALAALLGLASGHPVLALAVAASIWAPVALAATWLRRTGRLSATILLLTAIGAAGAMLPSVSGLQPESLRPLLEQEFRPMLERMFEASGDVSERPQQGPGAVPEESAATNLAADATVSPEIESLLARIAALLPGMLALAVWLGATLGLLLGRHWQSLIEHSGSYATEWRSLRLGKSFAVAALGLAAFAWWSGSAGAGSVWAVAGFNGLLPVAAALALQGAAVAHGLAALAGKGGSWWLVSFYALWALMLPYAWMASALMGWVDSWLDLRARARRREAGPGD